MGRGGAQQVPLFGRKARRPSSAGKAQGPRGDHAGLAAEPAVAKLLAKGGDTEVLFSERALRVNRGGLLKPKTFLVTERHVFTLSAAASGRVSRRIPLARLRAAFLSPLADNFLMLRIADEPDLFLSASFKTEALMIILERTAALTGRTLPVYVTAEFRNRHARGLERTVSFDQTSRGHTAMHLRREIERSWECDNDDGDEIAEAAPGRAGDDIGDEMSQGRLTVTHK